MPRISRALVASCSLVALAACGNAPKTDVQAEERAIRTLDDKWGPAVAKGDVEDAEPQTFCPA